MLFCPECGELNDDDSKFCKKCGFKIVNYPKKNINSSYEEYNPTYGRFTRKMQNKLENSKLVDRLVNKGTPDASKLHEKDILDSSINRKVYKYLEPAFVEVYDSIDDVYIKNLFIIEHGKLFGGGTFYTTPLTPYTTHTAHLSYEETIRFYENLLIKVKHDLKKEKQKPNFNEIEYYKRRKKELVVENTSNMGVQRRSR